MPKKPRQAHISQQLKRRKARRPAQGSTGGVPENETSRRGAPLADEPIFVDTPLMGESSFLGGGPVAAPAAGPRVGRRVGSLRTPQEPATTAATRVVPGQLPTFERAYLMRELRQIGIISVALLAVILILTILLR